MKENRNENIPAKREGTFLNAPLLEYMVSIGMAACLVGILYSWFSIHNWIAAWVNIVGFVLLTYLKIRYKNFMTQTLGCLVLLYLCFIYTPFVWEFSGGITSNITYGIFLFCCLIIVVLDGMLKRVMLGSYLTLIFTLFMGDAIMGKLYGQSLTLICEKAFVISIILVIMILMLSAIKKQMIATNTQLLKTAQTDELSEAFNARYLNKKLLEMEQSYEENDIDFCLAILDIDDFKTINDTYGHMYGDIMIKELADSVRKTIDEKTVQLCRYGGDEFVLIFFDDDRQAAIQTCENVRKNIQSEPVSDKKIHATISMGVCRRSELRSGEDILCKIDGLLYQSKKSGKNKVSAVYNQLV